MARIGARIGARIAAGIGYVLSMLFVMAMAAAAQDSGLTRLDTGHAARGWEAVGRLDVDGKGFCTGALIAPDLVLTAAHCLYERNSSVPVTAERIEFSLGLRNGQALAYRDVRRMAIHPQYQPGGAITFTRYDLALLELSQPIRLTGVTPFTIGGAIERAGEVGIVSYAHDRAESPSLQRVCSVLGEDTGVLVMSCDIDFGSSGAPVFVVAGGIARIVSVVSAKADMEGQEVAVGPWLGAGAEIAVLRGALTNGGSLFQGGVPGQARVIAPGERVDTGARFVRPD